ncbi:hypothetical protein [Helicobacter pylori]|uniref:hypothetical protein n=1 Tax=Helicobacter pylori TaxID=210 RepID=UPI00026A5067|nr:hypothetical protein [Helicobacter pylori]EJB59715.1 putative Hac prophage II protein [Helicobacter pylori Hp H-36]
MRQRNETETSFNKLREITQMVQAIHTQKNSALKPTKKAFSERQRITIRDNSQASAKEIKRGR